MRVFITGPSGVGKSTIIKEVLKKQRDMVLSVSYTTRSPRPQEIEGTDYFFVSKQTFEEMIVNHAFLEWAHVHNHLYGTSIDWVETEEKKGMHILFDIDVQGVKQAQEKGSRGCFIFLVPPTMEELSRRLNKRGTEDEQTLTLRLENARKELKCWNMYDFIVVNDTIDKAIHDIETIIDAYKNSKEETIGRLPWLYGIG